jgi:hypothetical protein
MRSHRLPVESRGIGGVRNSARRRLDRPVARPAGEAALGASAGSTSRHHEVSMRIGSGLRHGNRSWIRIMVPMPHCGHNRRLVPASAA